MPSATFHNLDPAKRHRLMRAARAEFARHDYADANLDRIAKAARIPKGSLYQYFKTKEDFYVYTVHEALDLAWEFYEDHIAKKKPKDCFDLVLEAMVHMALLQEQKPDLAALYARVVFARDTHARKKLFPKYIEHSNEHYESVIPWGIEAGLIDPDLPLPVIRFHLSSVGGHFQYLLLTGDFPSWLPANPRGMRRFATQLVDTLRHALAPRKPTKPRKGARS